MGEPRTKPEELLLPEDDPRVVKAIDAWAKRTHEVNMNYLKMMTLRVFEAGKDG